MKTGRYLWPQVPAGETAMVLCPYGGHHNNDSYAARYCRPEGQGGAVWDDLEDGNCTEVGHEIIVGGGVGGGGGGSRRRRGDGGRGHDLVWSCNHIMIF